MIYQYTILINYPLSLLCTMYIYVYLCIMFIICFIILLFLLFSCQCHSQHTELQNRGQVPRLQRRLQRLQWRARAQRHRGAGHGVRRARGCRGWVGGCSWCGRHNRFLLSDLSDFYRIYRQHLSDRLWRFFTSPWKINTMILSSVNHRTFYGPWLPW